MTTIRQLYKPHFEEVPLSVGLNWKDDPAFIIQEKMDGIYTPWQFPEAGGSLVLGERMKNGSYWPFDIIFLYGQDLRPRPLRERLGVLDLFCREKCLQQPVQVQNGASLQAIIERGGEGAVRRNLSDPFGAPWTKCKKSQTWDLVVTAKNYATGVLTLATPEGEPRGHVAAKREFDRIRVGDIVEIGGYGLTAKCLIREPRFLRVRLDKMQIAEL